jgi:hypothetical protein
MDCLPALSPMPCKFSILKFPTVAYKNDNLPWFSIDLVVTAFLICPNIIFLIPKKFY